MKKRFVRLNGYLVLVLQLTLCMFEFHLNLAISQKIFT